MLGILTVKPYCAWLVNAWIIHVCVPGWVVESVKFCQTYWMSELLIESGLLLNQLLSQPSNCKCGELKNGAL